MTCYDRDTAGAQCRVWVDGPAWNGLRTAAIGRFACNDPENGRELLKTIACELADNGMQAVIGPMDGDTWHSYRLVVQGSKDPRFLMEPPDQPAVREAFALAGFGEIARYASSIATLAATRRGLAGPADISLRCFDPGRASDDLKTIHALSSAAFVRSPFFTPITWADFQTLYTPILPRLNPELVMLAEERDGTPAGFVFGLPDQVPGRVILKTYASLRPGLGSMLCDVFHAKAQELGFDTVIHALMHGDNLSLRHSRRMGAEVFREYALFGKRLVAE